MALCEYCRNAENRIRVSEETANNLMIGTAASVRRILALAEETFETTGTACVLGFDGNYCVNWGEILNALSTGAGEAGITFHSQRITGVFQSTDYIREYKRPFIEHDPSLGYENRVGRIQDILDMDKVKRLAETLTAERTRAAERPELRVIYGSGTCVRELCNAYNYKFYFDMTRDFIMWALWESRIVPFGFDEPDPQYFWKDLYYVDFNLLDNQKWFIFENMDFYVEGVDPGNLTLLPRREYDELITTLLRYPVKQVRTFMPGAFGGYRFKQLWDVPGLGNSAWNSISSPKLDLLIDIGEKQIRLPSVNLLQYGSRLVGAYWDRECPKWWPLLAAIDDGYFEDESTPLERTAMCQHNHPSTDYVRRHFNEQFGRYETYYIVEAYENSATIMGFRDDANLEEWQAKCVEAAETKSLIPDWKDYVKIWNTAPGDLFLIPPGTTHGHGGRSMVLELDTNVNTTTCEYSFYMHDYGRHTWSDETMSMTGKKCTLQCEHGFNIDLGRRESWVKDHLRARPRVIKWTPDYSVERYSTLPEMPFHIERFHFRKFAENDTQGKFMNVLTLTVGDSVTIRSKTNPEYQTTLEWLQAAAVPATFGEYELINNGEGSCTVVQIRMKQG